MKIVRNPSFEGKTPGPLKVQCHDGTPFLSIVPVCGHDLHMHESQLDGAPTGSGVEAALRCPECKVVGIYDVAGLRAAFQQMRDEGWIE